MEAVPRLPMLSFPTKVSSKSTEFGEYLKRYIRDHYHEDPDSYRGEIAELESLRRKAVNASIDFVGCSSLKRYFCQLNFLTSRFPLEDVGAKLSFTWSSAFDQSVSDLSDIGYEMNSILYNIAALHTALGAADSRTSPDGMKISCTHFQCASWAFEILSQTSKGEGDFNSLLMTFMKNLALSQAQECILEKSMTDNRKPNIIAKVAMQVVEYLRLTLKNLESLKKSNAHIVSLVGSKLMKVWQRHCDFKIAYYLAVTNFHQGLQSEEQQKMGERISFYQGAVEKLDEAMKLSKNMEKAKVVGETLTFANDVIRGKLTAAQKENEFVYHEKIPQLSSLPEVKGASLVNGISFSFTDKEVAGPDIFSRLVPMEAHQASSLYSEEKAKLLRRITGEIHEKNDELEMYLASMQLDSFAFEENFDYFSQELVDACADLNSRDALKIMNNIMANINSYYHDLQAKIKETEGLMKQEEGSEKEFCLVMGTKRAPNQILTELKREVAKYREAHEAALTSNQALHNAIAQHKDNISLLSKPLNNLTESLPSVAGVESEADKATRMEVQRLLNKVQEMKNQRNEFENKLRMDLQNDDVTKQLVTKQEDNDKFFKKQISKHNQLVSLLEQNMSAQANILQALSEANAAYGAMRRTINQIKEQRSANISSLLSSYNAFLNITEKAEEAKEFYSKLETQVNKVNSRVKSFCKVQEEEREERLAANMKKMGNAAGLESYLDSKASGPKLKDFLQAGMGLKNIHNDGSPVDLNTRSAFTSGVSMPQMVPGTGYKSPAVRPSVAAERNDAASLTASQNAFPASTQYPPSAPSQSPFYSSQPTQAPYSQSNLATYSQSNQIPYSNSSQVTYSQPNQTPHYSHPSQASYSQPSQAVYYPTTISSYQPSQSPSISSMVTTNSINNVQYQLYNQPTNSSIAGYYAQNPSLGIVSSHSSVGAFSSEISSTPYQQPLPIDPRVNPQIGSTGSGSYIQQLANAQVKYPNAQPSTTNLNPTTQSQPSLSYTNSLSASGTSYTSGSYVSQAGAYQTNLSPSNQGQNLPISTEVRNSYINAPSQFTHPMYAPTTSNSFPSNNLHSTPKYDSYYSSSRPNIVTSTFSNSNSTSTVSKSGSQGDKSGNLVQYPQNRGALPVQYNSNFSENSVASLSSALGGWSPGNANQPSVYNQNTPFSSSLGHTDIKNPTTLPYQHYYSQTSLPVVNSNQYQVQTGHPSVPFSNGRSTTTVAYSQASEFSGIATSVNPTYSTQYQGPHYSTIQTGITTPGASPYSTQLPQHGQYVQPPHPSQSIQSSPVVSSAVIQPSKSSKEGISNLDLLSDIDMSVSSASLSSPLMPQTSNTASSSSNTDCPLIPASTDPDITSAVSSASSEDISTNGIAAEALSSDCALENISLTVSTSHVLDLSKLSKPKRLTCVLDPLTNDETLNALAAETERFSKFVLGLDKKSLNGPTNLELKWNEITDYLESKCLDLKVSVGRCYPLKNRFPDNLSFDATRVPLPSTRDDYINASFAQLKTVEDSIPFIITQAPMPNTFADFWTMVWENQVEIVVCINTDAEVKNQIYFAKETGESVEMGTFAISLKQARLGVNESWIQRTLHLTHNTLKTTKVVLHLQFLTWPPGEMPESPSLFLQFISEVHNLQKQQRNKLNPTVVHCVSGTGRSGALAVLSSFIKQLQSSGTLADIWNLLIELSQQRRAAIQDRTHLLFLYSAALYYAQEVLMKRGILTDKATFEEGPREKTHVRHPSSDLLSSDLSRMKAKLGFDEGQTNDNTLSRSGSQTSVLSAESSTGGSSVQPSCSQSSSVTPSPIHSAKGIKVGATELPPNLAASLDPNCLILTTPNPNKPKKITKENFLSNQSGGLLSLGHGDQQAADPLSSLDPLWNMKKS